MGDKGGIGRGSDDGGGGGEVNSKDLGRVNKDV